MIYLLAFITIYTLSAWYAWWWIRMAYYHPEGIWNGAEPNLEDYWFTFFPLVNTAFSFVTLYISSKDKPKSNNYNIFKPKNPLI